MRSFHQLPVPALAGLGLATIGLLVSTSAASAQYERMSRVSTQDYTLNGIEAWNVAKTNGFTFRPMTYGSGQQVTRPYDGVNTRLIRRYRDRFGVMRSETVARIVGGNPSVSIASRTVTFEMFAGQTLAPGWTIQGVSLSGSYVWDRRPQAGTQDPSFRIKITGTNSVTVRSVALRGPRGASPADAFVGRKTYTINGIEAWGVARQNGFTFAPVSETVRVGDTGSGAGLDDRELSTPHDGVNTTLTVYYSYRLAPTRKCTENRSGECLVASIVGGAASVPVPHYDGWRSLTVELAMFSGKRLAPGWTVRSVELSSGRWVRRPVTGSDDLSATFSLTSYPGRSASGHIRSIVLEGPSNASSWREAFTNAR